MTQWLIRIKQYEENLGSIVKATSGPFEVLRLFLNPSLSA